MEHPAVTRINPKGIPGIFKCDYCHEAGSLLMTKTCGTCVNFDDGNGDFEDGFCLHIMQTLQVLARLEPTQAACIHHEPRKEDKDE